MLSPLLKNTLFLHYSIFHFLGLPGGVHSQVPVVFAVLICIFILMALNPLNK